MKIIIRYLIIISIIIANALVSYSVVYVNDNGDYQADTDKFIPQKKTEFKASDLANKLENNMQRVNRGIEKQNEKSTSNNRNQTNTNYRKTYKWF